jgi:hypothetical protein
MQTPISQAESNRNNFYILQKTISLLLIFLLHATIDAAQIRYLHPPSLGEPCIYESKLCHRPMRVGSLRMDIETHGHKTIVHNYGHGGSGWTLAPGCVRYMVNQFETRQPSKNVSINIIGAGVIGLFTAYELWQRGYTNITLTAASFENLVSHTAGGFLAPSTMDIDPEKQKIIDDICFDAYRFYSAIAKGENNDFPSSGALIMPIYLKRDDQRLQAYEGFVMAPPQDVIIDFNNGKQYEMKVYDDGIFIDTNVMMNALSAYLHDKIKRVHKNITSLQEITETCIFNCAGLGAKELNNDDAVIPVQGHLLLLQHQKPVDMNYMISFYVDHGGRTASGKKVKRSIYLFPKHIPGAPDHQCGVLGGTFIENADAALPHQEEFDLMMQRAQEFFGN